MPDPFLVPGPMSFLGVGISGPMLILGGRVSVVPFIILRELLQDLKVKFLTEKYQQKKAFQSKVHP